MEATARDLTAREKRCCSFFTFTLASISVAAADAAPLLSLEIDVPESQVEVLDALQVRAMAAATRGEKETT